MQILAISDIHGNRTKLREILAAAGRADVIVLGGDLTHLGSPDEATLAVSLCAEHAPVVLTVTGHGLKDPQWALKTADGSAITPTVVANDTDEVAGVLGLAKVAV